MDVSSHQPRDLSALIAQYKIEHVIVKLYQRREHIENTPNAQDWSRWQIDSARDNACSVGGFVWLYKAWLGWKQAEDAIALAADCGLVLPRLDIDFEPYTDGTMPSVNQLWEAVNECWRAGIRPRIYSAKWVTAQYGIDLSEFAAAGVPLWAAQYSGGPTLDDVEEFGGWTHASGLIEGKQYSADGVDLNVFLRRAI